MAQWVRERLHPWNVAQPGVDWAYFVGLYMLSIASRSAAHRRIAERVLERFTLVVTPVRSSSVSASHVDRHLAELRDEAGAAASAIERVKHWRYLHALFGFGVERGYCVSNPVGRSSRPSCELSIVRAPRWRAVLALLAATNELACNDRQGLYLLVLLGVVTGLRADDLLSLKLADLELSEPDGEPVGLWWARNRKGRKVKVCGLPAVVEKLVVRRVAELPGGGRFFLWPSFPHNAWGRLVERAKVGALRFQGLRRAAGALAAASAVRHAGARQLQHSGLGVYRRHYEDQELEAVAVATALNLPELPMMPAFDLGILDRRGRRRAVSVGGGGMAGE
jgi:integrase